MEPKKFTQFGTFLASIMLLLLLLFTVIIIRQWKTNSPEIYIQIFVVLLFLFFLLTCYKLTITVDSTTVSFRLGIGWFGKSYKISDIKSCRPVTNSWFSGAGIRMIRNGWSYSVSGIHAIELQFKNKKSVVRIGTNKPGEISRLINSLIIGGETQNIELENSSKKWTNPLWFVLVLIPLLTVIPNFSETKVKFNETGFKISGVYGMTIPYSELEQIDTISVIPQIALRTNGYSFGKTRLGNFKFTDNSHAKLFIKTGSSPYLLIRSKDRVPIYINYDNKQETIDLYNELKDKM